MIYFTYFSRGLDKKLKYIMPSSLTPASQRYVEVKKNGDDYSSQLRSKEPQSCPSRITELRARMQD